MGVIILRSLCSLAGLVTLLLSTPLTTRAETDAFANIPRWTVLSGSVSPELGHARRLQPLTAERQVTVGVTLRVRDQSGLNRLLSALCNPASSSYGQFLSPSEFARRFAPDDATLARTIDWLRQQGLEVEGISRNRLEITARGSAATIQKAFDTPLYTFRQASHTFFANTKPVRIPASEGQSVLAVSGLSSSEQQHTWGRQRREAGAAHKGYTPSNIAHLYHLNSLHAGGVDGSGQTVAIVSFADYSAGNLAVFDRRFGLPAHVTRIGVSDGTSPGALLGAANGQDEIEADIEAVQGTAPGAAVVVYEAPNSSQGGVAVYNRVVSDDLATVVTTSWGNVESAFSTDDRNAIHQALEEGAAQGQAFFAPSGDYGAFDGAGHGRQNARTLAVDYPASDPWVTGVGGTTLQSRKSHYIRETVWSDMSDPWTPAGSGGGLSSIYPRPSYQQGPGVRNRYSTGMRQVPDIAANADPTTGYAAYVVGSRNLASWAVMGGTSEAAPLWASFAALVNQATGRRIGFLNPTLYALGQSVSTLPHPPFHDITQGQNLFYPATPGWDFATGWGSMDGASFVSAMTGDRARPVLPGGAAPLPAEGAKLHRRSTALGRGGPGTRVPDSPGA